MTLLSGSVLKQVKRHFGLIGLATRLADDGSKGAQGARKWRQVNWISATRVLENRAVAMATTEYVVLEEFASAVKNTVSPEAARGGILIIEHV